MRHALLFSRVRPFIYQINENSKTFLQQLRERTLYSILQTVTNIAKINSMEHVVILERLYGYFCVTGTDETGI